MVIFMNILHFYEQLDEQRDALMDAKRARDELNAKHFELQNSVITKAFGNALISVANIYLFLILPRFCSYKKEVS